MTEKFTKSHRRQFLQRSLLGALSIGFIPATISSLLYEHDKQDPLFDLLNRLAFKKLPMIPKGVEPTNEPLIGESQLDQSTTRVYKLGKTFCVEKAEFSTSGQKDCMTDFYQESSGGAGKVVTLNRIEVRTLSRMIPILQHEHNINQPEDLRALIIPVKNRNTLSPFSNASAIAGISRFGYPTKFGHCTIRIMAKGNRLKIDASILDKSLKEVYRFQHHETFNA